MFGKSLGVTAAPSQDDILALFGMKPTGKAPTLARPKLKFAKARFVPTGSISAPNKSIGQTLESKAGSALRAAGLNNYDASRWAGKLLGAFNDLTPVGNVTGADEGARMVRQGVTKGDLATGLLGGATFLASVLPYGNKVSKPLKSLMRDETGAIRAWHGSPHDFDKFEWSPRTRGTGEGAQAYGDGLYFAESEGVAKSYRNALSGPTQVQFAGEEIPSYHVLDNEKIDQLRRLYEARITPEDLPGLAKRKSDAAWQSLGPISLGRVLGAARSDAFAGKPPSAGLLELANNYRTLANARVLESDKAESLLKASIAEQISKSGRFEVKQPGRLYEVNINAEPEDFLDWDRPLVEQPNAMRALNGLDLSHMKEGNRTRVMLQRALQGADQPHYPATGRELLNAVSDYGDNRAGDLMALQPYGIKGVQFLDQGSRGAGQGTRNYVVPDHTLLSILNKY